MAVNLVSVVGDEEDIFQVYMPDEKYSYPKDMAIKAITDISVESEEPNVDFHSLAHFRWGDGWVFILEGRQLDYLSKYFDAFPEGHVPYFDGVEVKK